MSGNAVRTPDHDAGFGVQSNEWVYGTWPPRRAPRQRQATSSSSQQRSEPRPYFYRVQVERETEWPPWAFYSSVMPVLRYRSG